MYYSNQEDRVPRVEGLSLASIGDVADIGFNIQNRLSMKGQSLAGRLHGGLKIGMPFIAIDAVMSGAMAPRGHMMSAASTGLLTASLDTAAGMVAAEVGAAAGTAIMPGLGTVVGAITGFVAGTAMDYAARGPIGEVARAATSFHRNRVRLGMGGDYQDTAMAYTMRQRAAQEMSGSLLNARRWLGREGLLMHE